MLALTRILHALAPLRLPLVVTLLAATAPARAADPSVAGEILVKLTTASALPTLLLRHRLVQVAQFGARPIFRLGVIGAASRDETLAALRQETTVLEAEPNFVHAAPEVRKNNAWAIGTPAGYVEQWMPQAIHLADAHRLSTGNGVRVAVLDTGVDLTHPVLQGRLLPGYDFVDGDADPSEAGSPLDVAFGHGTHVAGLIALVAPAAQIVPMRVLDVRGEGNVWVLAEAMLHAVDPDGNPGTDDGAHVINLSLGTLNRTRIMDAIAHLASCAFLDADGAAAIDFSDAGYDDDRQRCGVSHGAVIAAAAGNGASRTEKQYPAAESVYGLIAVAASNSAGRLAGFSNFGSWLELAAPGEGITSSVPGGAFGTWSGTSMAAPLVAGTAALVRSLHPALSPKDIARRIERFSSDMCGASQRQVDAEAALTAARPPDPNCRR